MKLIRFGTYENERPGLILPSGKRIAIPGSFGDYNEAFFASESLKELEKWAEKEGEAQEALPTDIRIGSPVARPSKLVCIGLNYIDHAKEAGMPIPSEPVIFLKATSAIQGPYDPLKIPPRSQKTDWEVELAIVIGKRASYISKENAMDYVAGYAIHNDYSERAWQLESTGQWVKGKSADSFAPIGPWLATKDEVPAPHQLRLWLKVNGETKQDGNTSNFIFDIPTMVSYVSNYMSLLPGDVITTGTPCGVGMGFKPQQFLKPGDIVELGIDGLGEQKQLAVQS